MKPFLKTVGILAIANLVLFWAAYGLLDAAWPRTGLQQFLGSVETPLPSTWFVVLVWTFGILGAPVSILLDGVGSDHLLLLTALSSLLNAVVWGVIFGYPIFVIRRKRGHAAPA